MSAWMTTCLNGGVLERVRSDEPREPAVLDTGALDDVCGGDDVFRSELLGHFRASCRLLMTRLDEAACALDAVRLGETAHRLKGAALTIGANAFATALLAVERHGDAGDATRATLALEAARDAYAALRPRLALATRPH